MKTRKYGNRKIRALFLAVLTVLSLASCGVPSGGNSAAVTNPARIADREGGMVAVPERAGRIISVSPPVTETLVHLGLADRLVAVDMYSQGIEGLPENLPVFDIAAPDVESIAALKPDIVFASGMSRVGDSDPFKAIRDLGVFVTYIPAANSISDIKEDIRFIGIVTGTESESDGIIADFEKDIADVTTKITGIECEETVVFELATAPHIYSFGSGTFLNEIIEMLGAKNAFSGQNGWLSLSEEVVIEKNPDVIFTNVDYIDDPVGEILSRNGWNVVNAVKNGRVYAVDSNASSQSNEYITVAILQMAKALYPDVFE